MAPADHPRTRNRRSAAASGGYGVTGSFTLFDTPPAVAMKTAELTAEKSAVVTVNDPVCEPNGLVIHPGGYRITGSSLKDRKKDSLLVRQLLAVAQHRATADPTIRPQPRVKFLVEGGGSPSFWAARKQILFSGLGWPMSLQVTGNQNPRLMEPQGW